MEDKIKNNYYETGDSKWYDEYINQEFFAIINASDITNEKLVPSNILKSPELIDYVHQFLEKSPRAYVVPESVINNLYIVTSANLYDNPNLNKEDSKKCHEIISMANSLKFNDSIPKIKEELLDKTVIENVIELKMKDPNEFINVLYDSYYSDYLLYQTLFELETNNTFDIESYRDLVLFKGTVLSVISLINNYKDVLSDSEREFIKELLSVKRFLEENYSNRISLNGYTNSETNETITLEYSDEDLRYFTDEFDVSTINRVIDALYPKIEKSSKFSKILFKHRKRR